MAMSIDQQAKFKRGDEVCEARMQDLINSSDNVGYKKYGNGIVIGKYIRLNGRTDGRACFAYIVRFHDGRQLCYEEDEIVYNGR